MQEKGNYQEFKETLKTVNLNQTRFSNFVGLEKQSVSRWNTSGVPLWANRIIELLQENQRLKNKILNG